MNAANLAPRVNEGEWIRPSVVPHGRPVATSLCVLATVLALCAVGPGCGSVPPLFGADVARTDAVAGDAATSESSPACVPGRRYCEGGRSYTCDAASRRTDVRDCATAGATCVDGMGCVTCVPGARRCDAAGGEMTQVCSADGAMWQYGARCDASLGQRCNGGTCDDPCAQAAERRSYLGCEYYPVTLPNARTLPAETAALGPFTFPFAIAVANPNDYDVTATVDGGALDAPIQRRVPRQGLATIELPWVWELARTDRSSLYARGAYHLRTTAPVTVFQFNPLTYRSGNSYTHSADASLLLPATALGRHYTALTWRDGSTYGGTVTIVGVGANAETPVNLRVTPSEEIREGDGIQSTAARTTSPYLLRRGDVLQLVGGGDGDMSGTYIDATGPVAVYVGHIAAQVPVGRLAADHLEEQQIPDDAWGRRYAVSRFMDRPDTPSIIRVAAQREGTTLTFEPASAHEPVTLAAREVLEFETTQDFVVSGSAPILVLQLMEGQGTLSMSNGDPAMVFQAPIEQYRPSTTFLIPDTYAQNFVNIIGPSGAAPFIDGAQTRVVGRPLGATGQSVWSLEMSAGTHSVGQRDGSATYGVQAYGVAPYTSYAYPAGFDVRVINPG